MWQKGHDTERPLSRMFCDLVCQRWVVAERKDEPQGEAMTMTTDYKQRVLDAIVEYEARREDRSGVADPTKDKSAWLVAEAWYRHMTGGELEATLPKSAPRKMWCKAARDLMANNPEKGAREWIEALDRMYADEGNAWVQKCRVPQALYNEVVRYLNGKGEGRKRVARGSVGYHAIMGSD